jgi:hypothetical protein
VPPRGGYLGLLKTWPAGATRPNASTLNSYTGTVVANAAIVPASTTGAINVYVSDKTDVLFDVNGYFASPIFERTELLPGDSLPRRRYSSRRGISLALRRTDHRRRTDAYGSRFLEPLWNCGECRGLYDELHGRPAGEWLTRLVDGMARGSGSPECIYAHFVYRRGSRQRSHRSGWHKRRDQPLCQRSDRHHH